MSLTNCENYDESDSLFNKPNRFENFNSFELSILKEYFNTIPLMDKYIANIIESYIYSIQREYYKDGSLKCQYRTKYGEIKDGEYTSWFINGQLNEHGFYINGKIHGQYTNYYHDGKLSIQCMYLDGKKHGLYKDWYRNGQLSLECNYITGKFYGEYTQWHDNGQLCQKCKFVDGKLQGDYTIYDDNGLLYLNTNYLNGEKQVEK